MQTTATDPAAAITTLARAALTVEQFYCYDESDGQIITHSLTRCAEHVARMYGLPETEMDAYRRTVFSEGPATQQPLDADELAEARAMLATLAQNTVPESETFTDALGALDSLRQCYEAA